MSVTASNAPTDPDKLLAETEQELPVSEGLLRALELLDEARRELGLKVSSDPPERRLAS